MDSIKKIYKIGNGPSSSHTMGPKRACEIFHKKNAAAASYKAHIFGSLALTGKGHLTDIAILDVLGENAEIIWHPNEKLPIHTNGMRFEAFGSNENLLDSWEVYSIGGGEITDANSKIEPENVYPHSTMKDIMQHLDDEGGTFWKYVFRNDKDDLKDHLKLVWETMKDAIRRGLNTEGTLPGGLKLLRKAAAYNFKAQMQNQFIQDDSFLFAYALAVSEENEKTKNSNNNSTVITLGIEPSVAEH